ncbi:MAG TPA: hypothetical protein VFC82_05180 [Actinomycetaceae bacterium]|nr:hypothetical protein [Actinomycetaceae bacterium]
MRKKLSVGVPSAAVAAVLLLAGCGATGDAEAAPGGSGQGEAACTGFSDVMTIVENADTGVGDGRMDPQEQQGWYRLATRVLDRLPSGGDGAVDLAVVDLQGIAPAVAPGAGTEVVGIGSPEWHSATETLADACGAAGVELTIDVFTGG